MRARWRATIAVAVPLFCVAGRQVAFWASEELGCGGDVKHLHACEFAGVDLLPIMGIGLFWLPVLAILSLPVSLWVVGKAIESWFRRTAP